jgi:tRNA(Arg) A34 adenosine deaminase TadA
MNIWHCFTIAAAVAAAKDDSRDFLLGAVGIRSDGIRVVSPNGPAMICDKLHHKSYYKEAHAEYRLCRKLNKNSVVFVVRISKTDGRLMMAKPCTTCQIALKRKRVKKVYYSISDTEYGVMTF